MLVLKGSPTRCAACAEPCAGYRAWVCAACLARYHGPCWTGRCGRCGAEAVLVRRPRLILRRPRLPWVGARVGIALALILCTPVWVVLLAVLLSALRRLF